MPSDHKNAEENALSVIPRSDQRVRQTLVFFGGRKELSCRWKHTLTFFCTEDLILLKAITTTKIQSCLISMKFRSKQVTDNPTERKKEKIALNLLHPLENRWKSLKAKQKSFIFQDGHNKRTNFFQESSQLESVRLTSCFDNFFNWLLFDFSKACLCG